MFKTIQNKNLEKKLVTTIALNWGVTRNTARKCLYMFKKQKTK